MEGLFGNSMLLPMLLMFAVFFFFMILPQQKKAKKEKQFMADLKKGTRVVTKGGLHGRINEMHDNGTIVLDTSAGKMTFERSAISMDASQRINAAKK